MEDPRLRRVPVSICDYPSQPRTNLDLGYCEGLGANMKAVGQRIPILGYFDGKRFKVHDGGCRLKGAELVGMTELLALDVGKEPTKAELLMVQASIDVQKQHLPPLDRAKLFEAIIAERKCTAKQVAADLGV